MRMMTISSGDWRWIIVLGLYLDFKQCHTCAEASLIPHYISFVNCFTGGRLSDQQTSLWSLSWGWGSSRGEKTPWHECWYNKISADIDNLENIDRDVNHLDNQKHLCRELLLGCTKPMDSTASNGPGRQYSNPSTSISLSWVVHFLLSALTTTSRVLWEATLLTFTWWSISSESILSSQ